MACKDQGLRILHPARVVQSQFCSRRMARVSARPRIDSDQGHISTGFPQQDAVLAGASHPVVHLSSLPKGLTSTASFLHPIPLNCSNLNRGGLSQTRQHRALCLTCAPQGWFKGTND
eukprot:72567-Chlamydomonas_euryale.AAC.1